MPSKSRLGQTPRDLSAGKIPFLRSKGEGRSWRRWRKPPPRRKEDSPLWKCQARRVNIWQPPSELPLISSLFSISDVFKTEHRPRINSSPTDNSSFPTSANIFDSRASPQRGEVACSTNQEYGFVCHLYSVGTISYRRQ